MANERLRNLNKLYGYTFTEEELDEIEKRSKEIPLMSFEEFCNTLGITKEEYKKILEEAQKNPKIIERAFSTYMEKSTPEDKRQSHK